MESTTRYTSVLTRLDDSAQAVTDLCQQLRSQSFDSVDLLLLFFSPGHVEHINEVIRSLKAHLRIKHLIGCSVESVISQEGEIEGSPGMVAWCAQLPQCQIDLCHLQIEQTADGMALLGWTDDVIGSWPSESVLFALGEPFSGHFRELGLHVSTLVFAALETSGQRYPSRMSSRTPTS